MEQFNKWVPVNFTTKAILYSEEQGFTDILKTFLFKCGLRETIIVQDPAEIGHMLHDNYWPIVFVDHTDGHQDGFSVFDGIYKTVGYELLPYVFMCSAEKKVYQLFGLSAGARGILKRPLQPNEAGALIKQLIPPAGDAVTNLALQISKIMNKGDFQKAIPALTKLQQIPQFKRGAEIALIRCDIYTGQHLKAEERLKKLHLENDKDIRVLSEMCDFYKRNCKYAEAIKYYNMIRHVHPRMTLKIWDQFMLHMELDHLDEAASILEEMHTDLTFGEMATDAVLRILIMMGIPQYSVLVTRSHPALTKHFSHFLAHQGRTNYDKY